MIINEHRVINLSDGSKIYNKRKYNNKCFINKNGERHQITEDEYELLRSNRVVDESADIDVKNPGILEVPDNKSVDELPVSHFKSLIDKKGRRKIISALNNLQIWNKNDNKKLSNWAKSMKDKIGDYGKK